LVERVLAKHKVDGSKPFTRSRESLAGRGIPGPDRAALHCFATTGDGLAGALAPEAVTS
jgi:hypothetical protein